MDRACPSSTGIVITRKFSETTFCVVYRMLMAFGMMLLAAAVWATFANVLEQLHKVSTAGPSANTITYFLFSTI